MRSTELMPPTSVFVRPPTPLTPETVSLSPSDQFMIRNYVTPVLFFKIDSNSPIEENVSLLKQSLANTIAEIPFLAGILVLESEERCTLEIQIPEDGGVEFRVNDMRNQSGCLLHDYEMLAAAGFPPSALDFDLLVAGPRKPPPESACLTVQANFINGGLLLATKFHHSMMDGSGLFTFFECLSKYMAASSRGQIVQPWELIPKASFDRTLISMPPSKHRMSEYPGFRTARKDSWAAKADTRTLMARLTEQSEQFIEKKVMKSWWIMTPDQLLKLEELTASSGRGKSKATLNSTISALFWRHIVLARRLENEGVEHCGLTTVCDFRARLEPPLPASYVGNALIFAKAIAPVAEICSSEPDTPHKTASRITDSVNWWNAEKIESFLAAVEGTEDMQSVEWDCDSHFGTDIQVTSTLGSASPYSLDWGEKLGNMQALRFPKGAFLDGCVTVLPRLPDGSIEFVLNLSVELFKRLKADEQFTRYATFLCR